MLKDMTQDFEFLVLRCATIFHNFLNVEKLLLSQR